MTTIHGVATLASKGKSKLPESIRLVLRLDAGRKFTFNLQGTQVVVSRADPLAWPYQRLILVLPACVTVRVKRSHSDPKAKAILSSHGDQAVRHHAAIRGRRGVLQRDGG